MKINLHKNPTRLIPAIMRHLKVERIELPKEELEAIPEDTITFIMSLENGSLLLELTTKNEVPLRAEAARAYWDRIKKKKDATPCESSTKNS